MDLCGATGPLAGTSCKRPAGHDGVHTDAGLDGFGRWDFSWDEAAVARLRRLARGSTGKRSAQSGPPAGGADGVVQP